MTLSEFDPTYFELDHRHDVTIARFTVPRLTDDENIEQLGHELFTLVDQFDRLKLILSLSEVQFLTSSVLGKMITLHRKLHRMNGKVILCEIMPEVRDVLRASRLIDYFHTADDVDAALVQLQHV